MKEIYKDDYDSYIAASYVKAVEASGARVVPIFLNMPEEYYRHMVKSINGLLLPGGNTWFYEKDNKTPRKHGYLKAAEILYNEIKAMNDEMRERGMVFPILGICLGFEVLLFIDAGKTECRDECKLIQAPLPVELQDEYKADPNWKELPTDIFKENVSFFSHQFYITEEKMNDTFKTGWKLIATTEEKERGITIVSIVESKNYPIIGLQFHPEKTPYEWKEKFNIPHSRKAIIASRYFFDWLVTKASLNNNCFKEKEEERKHLVSNYQKTFPNNDRLSFDEIYFFSRKSQ